MFVAKKRQEKKPLVQLGSPRRGGQCSVVRDLVRTPNMVFKVNPDLADIVFFSTDSDAQDTLET